MRKILAIIALIFMLAVVACSTDVNEDSALEPTITVIPTSTPATAPTSVHADEPTAMAKVLQLSGISVDDRLSSDGDVEALLVTCIVRNPSGAQVTEEISARVRFVQILEQFHEQFLTVAVDPEQVERFEFSFAPPPQYDFSKHAVNVDCR